MWRKSESFVRICGDSPLIDPTIINKMLKIYKCDNYDIVTNRYSRFPSGQIVEIINSKKFIEHYNLFNTPEHYEHVTSYFYEKPKSELDIYHLENNVDYNKLKLSIDTISDFKNISKIIRLMNKKHINYTLEDISNLAQKSK